MADDTQTQTDSQPDPQTDAKVDTLLLDVDGTVIDSTYHHAVAWARAFAGEDVEVELWRLHKAIGMGGDKLVAHVAGDEVEEAKGDALREAWEAEYERMKDQVRLLPGTRELIEQAQERGLKVVFASSGKESFMQSVLDLLPGVELDGVTTSDDAEASKPEPDILQVALDKVGGTRGLLVGDTTWDAKAADRAGVPMIGVLTGGFSEAELREAGAVEVVEDLSGVDLDRYV